MKSKTLKHPGQLFRELYIQPLGLTPAEAAKALGIANPTLSNFLNGRMDINVNLAARLAIVFKTSEKFWLDLQLAYDVWNAKRHQHTLHVIPLKTIKKTTKAAELRIKKKYLATSIRLERENQDTSI